jgi:ABC-type xylose transport system substrate-binding protein
MDQLRVFYLRVDEENRAFLASLPKIKRWNAKAAQKFFTDFLSGCMTETYAQPLDAIVAALAEVAFDLHQGLDAETVRGRRRIAGTPENSKRKSR